MKNLLIGLLIILLTASITTANAQDAYQRPRRRPRGHQYSKPVRIHETPFDVHVITPEEEERMRQEAELQEMGSAEIVVIPELNAAAQQAPYPVHESSPATTWDNPFEDRKSSSLVTPSGWGWLADEAQRRRNVQELAEEEKQEEEDIEQENAEQAEQAKISSERLAMSVFEPLSLGERKNVLSPLIPERTLDNQRTEDSQDNDPYALSESRNEASEFNRESRPENKQEQPKLQDVFPAESAREELSALGAQDLWANASDSAFTPVEDYDSGPVESSLDSWGYAENSIFKPTPDQHAGTTFLPETPYRYDDAASASPLNADAFSSGIVEDREKLRSINPESIMQSYDSLRDQWPERPEW